jgi:serine/threonine-protein kinase
VGDYLLADCLWNAASAEWGLKALDRAEADYREALRLMTRAQGADSPRVGRLHGNLAMIMRSRSRYPEALIEAELGLAIDLRALGPEHPAVQIDHGNLGLTHYHLGHFQRSRELLAMTAAAQRAQSGADSPALAGTLINLGLVRIEAPDLGAAENAFSESLCIWEKHYGRDYPGARLALGGLGTVHVLQGLLDRGEAELIEVQKADEKRDDRDDASIYYWLGEARRLRKDAAGAVSLDRQALQRAQQGSGENSRYTALAHHYLGLALRDSGNILGAEKELRAALAAFSYLPNAAHPWAASTGLELAGLLVARADAGDERRQLVVQAISIREQFLGAEDPRTVAARTLLLQVSKH